jgi:hypothetical protein
MEPILWFVSSSWHPFDQVAHPCSYWRHGIYISAHDKSCHRWITTCGSALSLDWPCLSILHKCERGLDLLPYHLYHMQRQSVYHLCQAPWYNFVICSHRVLDRNNINCRTIFCQRTNTSTQVPEDEASEIKPSYISSCSCDSSTTIYCKYTFKIILNEVV